jgi:hypothetical protein
VSKNNIFSGDEDDILGLIGAVYGGDATQARESTVDHAVAVIEAKNRRAYSSMRQFAETGKVAPRIDIQAEVDDLAAVAPSTPDPAAATPAEAEAAAAAATAEKTEKLQLPPPAEVISGTGAEFFDPGKTRTHIIRPKKGTKG